jgi:hypothetical protein
MNNNREMLRFYLESRYLNRGMANLLTLFNSLVYISCGGVGKSCPQRVVYQCHSEESQKIGTTKNLRDFSRSLPGGILRPDCIGAQNDRG